MKKILIMLLSLSLITAALCACGGGNDSSGSGSDAEAKNAYMAIVVDEKNAPVEGVSVQLCSDDACVMQQTDATGVAEFQVDEGKYTIHILSVPEGFAEDSTEYEVPEAYSVVNIVLKKAE